MCVFHPCLFKSFFLLLYSNALSSSDALELLVGKSWKERQEGLNQLNQLLSEHKFIEGSGQIIQETLARLAKSCCDVNKIIGKNSLVLLETFAKAMRCSDAAKLVK
ncbi:unnamed protein product [Protopolystoma xenopodis]|uniref:CLASP N-terminal domain-containing protein n=1 Tax=Protopolystoma xenopodis TaxID=117903 RepID=A0A448WKH7_9PLAT|nr:unnamed protein product [Protopolystoma xenopodis]